MATFGVVYVAYGAPYLAMAVTSLISLRVTNPTVPVCIITNVVKELPSQPWWQPEIGDRWIVLEEETGANRNAKTSVYGLSPFDLTLYLDCDTMVLGDLSPIPGYLEYFDLLLSPVYRPNPRTKRRILEGKYRYTEDGHFNGGVFGFLAQRGGGGVLCTMERAVQRHGVPARPAFPCGGCIPEQGPYFPAARQMEHGR